MHYVTPHTSTIKSWVPCLTSCHSMRPPRVTVTEGWGIIAVTDMSVGVNAVSYSFKILENEAA